MSAAEFVRGSRLSCSIFEQDDCEASFQMHIPQFGFDLSNSNSSVAGKSSRYPGVGQISGECEIDGSIQLSGDVAEEGDAYRLESNMLSTM